MIYNQITLKVMIYTNRCLHLPFSYELAYFATTVNYACKNVYDIDNVSFISKTKQIFLSGLTSKATMSSL